MEGNLHQIYDLELRKASGLSTKNSSPHYNLVRVEKIFAMKRLANYVKIYGTRIKVGLEYS